MHTWRDETLGLIVIVASPKSVLNQIRETPGTWWKIVTPRNPHWLCSYQAGRWVFSIPGDGRKEEHYVGAHLLLESLQAKSYELRLEPHVADKVISNSLQWLAVLAILTALVVGLVIFLVRGLSQ